MIMLLLYYNYKIQNEGIGMVEKERRLDKDGARMRIIS